MLEMQMTAIIHFTDSTIEFRACSEFDGTETNLYVKSNWNLRYMLRDLPIQKQLETSIEYATDEILTVISLGEVYACSLEKDTDIGAEIYLVNLSINEKKLHLDLYFITSDSLVELKRKFSVEPYIALDLDDTLIHARECGSKKFKPDFSIEGVSLITETPFTFDVMLRPKVALFLREVLAMTPNVAIVSTGDLHYIQKIVDAANKNGWCDHENPVFFDVRNVFSVKENRTDFQQKNIGYVFSEARKWVGIDDKIDVWDPSTRDHVLKISPFVPGEKTVELLKMIPKIKQRLA